MAPLLKPSTCDGCPLQHHGTHWVPDEVVPGAETYLLMQNPGASEVEGQRFLGYAGTGERWEPCAPAPAIGKTGRYQEDRFFPLAGLERGKNVSLGNVIRCRVGDSNALPPLTDPTIRQAMIHCQSKHFHPPDSTRLLVAQGEYALWATTGELGTDAQAATGEHVEKGRSLTAWRGWMLPHTPPHDAQQPPPRYTEVYTPSSGESTLPVLITYHVASLFRAPWERIVVQRDWVKIREYLDGTWPEPFPEILRRPPLVWPALSAFDTEFGGPHLIRYSMAYRERLIRAPSVWVVEAGYNTLQLPTRPTRPRVVMHNAAADIGHLTTILGGGTDETPVIEDTMVQHALLWSDLAHNLGFLGSMYARTNRWKHLVETNPIVYSGGDALGTWDSWVAMSQELQRDPPLDALYAQFMRVLPLLLKSEPRGIKVNQRRVREVIAELERDQAQAIRQVQAAVGWPINLGSPQQVARMLYDVEHVGATTRRRVSLDRRGREEDDR